MNKLYTVIFHRINGLFGSGRIALKKTPEKFGPVRGKITVLSVLLLFLFLVLVIPASANHNVTFVNTCDKTVWINLQGGPKGVCDGVTDPNTHQLTKCSACSPCPAVGGTQHLCNTSAATGDTEPMCCPGVVQDQLYCWNKINQCNKGVGACCPGIPQTANTGYNCPGANETTGCQNSSMTQEQIDALSGYNNPANGLSHIVCNGTLISGGGFELAANTGTKNLSFDTGWQGAFYPRTNCSFVNGIGTCETGNCKSVNGSSLLECGGVGSTAPATKGEMNLDDDGDWYDVSWVDGFNVAMVIQPTRYDPTNPTLDVNHYCTAAGCSLGLSAFSSPRVPDWNVLKYPSASNFVGIMSDCSYFSTLDKHDDATNLSLWNGYCCPIAEGYVNDSAIDCKDVPAGKTCKTCAGQKTNLYPFTTKNALPNSADLFFDTCSKAYAYTYNDTAALMRCHGSSLVTTDYKVTLSCPSGRAPTLTPAPTTAGNSGDSSSSLGSTDSSGSTVGTAPASNAAGTVSLSFNQQPAGNSQVGVSHVQISTGTQTESFAVTAQTVSLGDAMQVQGQPVAGYLQISPVGVPRGTITSGTITFVVSGAWLTANNIAPANVELMRYSNNQWNALPTTFVSQSGNNYYFSAVTPGFSYFAITVKQQDTTTANATVTGAAAEGTLLPAKATLTGGIPVISTAIPVTGTPVATQTTVPPSVSPATVGGFSAMTLGIAIAVLVIIVIAAFLIRRWWIRRQNPALFKKLD